MIRVPLYKRLIFWGSVALLIAIPLWMLSTGNLGSPVMGAIVAVPSLIVILTIARYAEDKKKRGKR